MKYLFGVIALVILVTLLCIVIAYFVHRTRVQPPVAENNQATNSDENNFVEIYEIDITYEEIDEDHSASTATERPAPGEPNDDHIYAEVNEVFVQENAQHNQTRF